MAACNALGLFGGEARLVVVDGVDVWKSADIKELESYLAAPAPTTVLALVGDGVKRDSALAKAVAKAGDLLVYDVPKKKLPEWVGEQFARLGASADRDACRALVEAVGDNAGDLASEIQKLATWANGEQITRANVEQLAVGRAETPIFAVTDAWGRRDAARPLAPAALGRADSARRLARGACRPRQEGFASGGRGRPLERDREPAEAAPLRRGESRETGGEFLVGGAGAGDSPAGGARRRREGRLTPPTRASARAHAR